MHIAIDARIINSSTGRYIERLLTYLQAIDTPHTFSVLVRAKDKSYWQPTSPNFTIVVADYHQYTFSEQLGFALFLQRLGADLVHFCMPQQPLLYHGVSVTTVHDLSLLKIDENDGMSLPVLKMKQVIFSSVLRRAIKRSAYIITPSHYTKDDVLRFQPVPDDNVIVTYESADPVSTHEEAVDTLTDKQFLLVVGRAEPYKNQRGAIEAHQLLLQRYPHLQLVIVGNRDQTSYKLEDWSLREGYRNIVFFGFASDDQLAWLYRHAATYVFPSFMEGFGLPGLEAMKHGAPVASSNTTCLPEIYGDAAIYFNPADSHDMAQKIDVLLSSNATRRTYIKRGTKKATEYSWQRMAEQTLAIYDQALLPTNSVVQ